MTEEQKAVLERVALAGIEFSAEEAKEYIKSSDALGKAEKGAAVPAGYKRCGRCGVVKKFYLYNKNSGSKTNTSGNCKECQKKSAGESYKKTKKNRNYKKYYEENKERKQAHARAYYEKNKEAMKEKHKQYVQSKAGKKVMQKAHAKRREALNKNAGVPYTRSLVIARDGEFLGHDKPICYLCNLPIEDTSGKGLHLDHVVPVVIGGLNCFTNVACSHAACNLKREKDARELAPVQIQLIVDRANKYITKYPEKFER